jgi:glutamate synthase (NADPH/NADH) small chain
MVTFPMIVRVTGLLLEYGLLADDPNFPQYIPLPQNAKRINSEPCSRIKTSARGYVITENEPFYGMTTRAGVFAVGDVAHQPKTVILAMREGRRVAEATGTFLQTGNGPHPRSGGVDSSKG